MLTSCLPWLTLIIMLNVSGSSRSAIRTRKLFTVQRTICMCFSVLKTSLLTWQFAERLTTHKRLKFLCQLLNLNLKIEIVSPAKIQRDLGRGRESFLREIVNKNQSEVLVENLHLPKRKSKLTFKNPSKVKLESEAVNLMIRIKIKRTSLSTSSRLSRLIKLSKLMNR